MSLFIALHPVSEDRLLNPGVNLVPPRFAVLMASTPGGITLVFSRHRQVWELPGGLIDPGESARHCAAREFREETGGEPGELEWLGLVEVYDRSTVFGAVYRCTARHVPANFTNWETGGLAYWTRERAPHPLGESDAALLTRFG